MSAHTLWGNENSTKERHSEEQIIGILMQVELHPVPIQDLYRQHNVSEQTFYADRISAAGWKAAVMLESPDQLARIARFVEFECAR